MLLNSFCEDPAREDTMGLFLGGKGRRFKGSDLRGDPLGVQAADREHSEGLSPLSPPCGDVGMAGGMSNRQLPYTPGTAAARSLAAAVIQEPALLYGSSPV